MPKRLASGFLRENPGGFRQFFVLVVFYEGRRSWGKFSHVSSVFLACSPSDWSVEVGFWGFPAVGRERGSAKTFDSYLCFGYCFVLFLKFIIYMYAPSYFEKLY